ncbi:Organic cation transporter protein [Pseudolycoriella hygida]|uniref:Organic cation transporter protein n=1 Tax=Pseudolycoriella hygida TaxID=35572 RepID=A0A9Q0RY08_9DIPT|nr:Organic cation transporter protein [Pseudolycoriella hygida]
MTDERVSIVNAISNPKHKINKKMVNRSDQIEAKPKVFHTNLNHFDASTDKKCFGKMNGDKVPGGDVPVIKFSGDRDEKLDENCDSDVISKYIGHYGWWQFFWTFLLVLCQCPSTFQIYAFVFQGYRHPFHCARPEGLESINITIWRQITKPCEANDLKSILSASEQTLDTSEDFHSFYCDAYEFEGDENVISEWNLVCDEENLVYVVEMCFLAGAAIGSICSGWVSDRFGRRHTLMVLILMQAIFGILVAFSTSLTMFMVLRIILGFASMGVTMVSFVLVVELVSGKWRTIIGVLDILPVAVSYILIAGIAYAVPQWRQLQLVITVPWISFLFAWYYLPESPRWLLENGKIEELIKVINIAAKWNKIELPPGYEKTLHKPEETLTVSFAKLFKANYCRTTILMIVIWYALILIYFGLTLHLAHLGGDIYINTIIAGLLEAVSILLCIFVVLKLGLKINLVIYMLVAGAGCLAVNFLPDGNYFGVITFAMIVKCSIGATNALIPTFTAIQYPTTMRTLSVGIGNFAAGIALITVPYLWLLENVQKDLPMTLMGLFGIIGAGALMLMKDKELNLTNDEKNVKGINVKGTTGTQTISNGCIDA